MPSATAAGERLTFSEERQNGPGTAVTLAEGASFAMLAPSALYAIA
jgi:hypothetical protein